VSVLLRPRVDPERLGLVTMAAGVAAIAAVGRVARIEARLKWPNDLVVDDRKLAGILAEKDGDAVVVGMGLNVAWNAFPPDIAATATACNLLTAAPVAREELLVAWLVELDRRLDALDETIDEARARSATIGRRVRVELVRETFEADAIGVTDAGLLVVRRDDGRELALSAGDVVHLRAEG
jgi:BirA family biotin operon repressor/biotin-[acetyl-CoA-carboxylase] ligase